MTIHTLNAVGLLNLEHLVVDEYQDLNPMDLEFVDALAAQGARLFVAGDDDQSIYSFRSPPLPVFRTSSRDIPTAGSTRSPLAFGARPTSS
jgi:ATP-dependent exoDNAse (exonuclease V) beta subunit